MGKRSSNIKPKRRKSLIQELAERDGWICDSPLDPQLSPMHDEGATLDHHRPRSLGGTNEVSNLRLAHRCCNIWRGNPDFE